MKRQNKKRGNFQEKNMESRIEMKDGIGMECGILGELITSGWALSKFSETGNQNSSNMFPIINDPTLEFKDTEESNHRKLEHDLSLQHYESEGLTARLSYQERSASQLFMLEERIETLLNEIDKKESQLSFSKKKCDSLQKELDKAKKQLHRKNQQLQSQEKQLTSLKQKQSTLDLQSRNSYSSSKSLIEESLQNFCPQLLSPDETVQLLNQLLKKVSKSSKMMKSLSSDNTTKQILTKISKN